MSSVAAPTAAPVLTVYQSRIKLIQLNIPKTTSSCSRLREPPNVFFTRKTDKSSLCLVSNICVLWFIKLTVVPPPTSQTNKTSFSCYSCESRCTRDHPTIYPTLNMPGILRAVWTAAASASVNPMDAVWLAEDPNPAASMIFRNRSTVVGFHVVGTEKTNSIFASSHRLASSPMRRASIVRQRCRK